MRGQYNINIIIADCFSFLTFSFFAAYFETESNVYLSYRMDERGAIGVLHATCCNFFYQWPRWLILVGLLSSYFDSISGHKSQKRHKCFPVLQPNNVLH